MDPICDGPERRRNSEIPMPHTVALHNDETAASLASRLAFANKLPSAEEFAADFGFTQSQVVNGDAPTMIALANLGGVRAVSISERSFRPAGKTSFQILGHKVAKQHMVLGANRIGPACFRSDVRDGISETSLTGAYARVLWVWHPPERARLTNYVSSYCLIRTEVVRRIWAAC